MRRDRVRDTAIKLAATYLGTVVGAGFASGQEHLHFFAGFSSGGDLGVLLAGALFIVFGVILADLASTHATSLPEDLLVLVGGNAMAKTLDLLLMVFTFCSLCIMLAGSGALFKEHAGIPGVVGTAITGAVALIAAAKGVDGLLSMNTLLSPILLGVPVAVAAASAALAGHGALPPHSPPGPEALAANVFLPAWPVSSIVYVSYNLLLVVAAFASMGYELANARTARRGAALGGAALLVFLSAIHISLELHGGDVWKAEVPMMVAASRLGPGFKVAYSAALWVAMVTTAAAGCFALSRAVEKRIRVSRRTAAVPIAITTAAMLLAKVGFARLVGRVYPVFGYLGLPLILGMAAAYARDRVAITIVR